MTDRDLLFATPVETADVFPRFCQTCGRRLIVEDRTGGFNPATGAPRIVAYAYCRGSWVDRLFGWWAPHEGYFVSPRPPGLPRRPNPTERWR